MIKPERIDPTKKLYVVNTCRGSVHRLHINDGRCCHVRGIRKGDYRDFDTEKLAYKSFGGNLLKCGVCYKKELKSMEG